MLTLIRQEFYKLGKRKTTFILPVVVMIFMLIAAIMTKQLVKEANTPIDGTAIFTQLFSATTWIVYLMIFAGSTLITQEFEYGTIKNLLYRQYSRGQVLLSKWITLLILNVFYFVISTIFAIILKVIFFPSIKFNSMIDNHSVVNELWLSIVGAFITTWLVLSLVVMMSTLFKNSAVSVTFGVVFYIATSAMGMFEIMAIERWDWIKWSPLNMMNLKTQIIMPELHHVTHLQTNTMLWMTLVYVVAFLSIGYFAFTRRKNY